MNVLFEYGYNASGYHTLLICQLVDRAVTDGETSLETALFTLCHNSLNLYQL